MPFDILTALQLGAGPAVAGAATSIPNLTAPVVENTDAEGGSLVLVDVVEGSATITVRYTDGTGGQTDTVVDVTSTSFEVADAIGVVFDAEAKTFAIPIVQDGDPVANVPDAAGVLILGIGADGAVTSTAPQFVYPVEVLDEDGSFLLDVSGELIFEAVFDAPFSLTPLGNAQIAFTDATGDSGVMNLQDGDVEIVDLAGFGSNAESHIIALADGTTVTLVQPDAGQPLAFDVVQTAADGTPIEAESFDFAEDLAALGLAPTAAVAVAIDDNNDLVFSFTDEDVTYTTTLDLLPTTIIEEPPVVEPPLPPVVEPPLPPVDEDTPTAGDDVLVLTSGDDVIDALGGNDVVRGLGGKDWIIGGDGDDSIDGGRGDDALIAGDPVEPVEGEEAGDALPAQGGLYGGEGADSINGRMGTDYIDGGAGDDDLRGGLGGDSADAEGAQGEGGLYGGEGDDFIRGNRGSDDMFGGDGNDDMNGGFGDDDVYGDAGNDKLSGFDGSDTLYGGDGDDVMSGGRGDFDVLYGGEGNDTLRGGAGDDALDGGAGDDLMIDKQGGFTEMFAGEGNDTMLNGNGDSVMFGDDGDDTVKAGGGFDQIFGDAGNDTIDAGAGDDFVQGGAGDDVMTGGAGNDNFLFTTDDGENVDTITDFTIGSDTLEIGNTGEGAEFTFDDLFLSQEESVAVIQAGELTIRLENVDVDDLSEDDFALS